MIYISTFYVWFVGVITYFIIFTITLLLSPFLSTKKLHFFFRHASRVALWLLFFKFERNYEEAFDDSQPYIYMPNHVSIFDVMVSAAYSPSYTNGIEADTHFKIFYFGWILKILKQIPIDRTNIRKSLKSFEIAKERLKNGVSIVVYPEGTRSKTGKLQTFKKIPFKFAKEAEVSVMPIGYIGIEKVSPQKSIWIKPTKIIINYGKPISKEQIEKMTIDELKEKVRNDISRLITPKKS